MGSAQYEKTLAQLEGLHSEIDALSKKKPDDSLNKFKLGFVNKIISESNEILGKKYIPFENFSTFEEDNLPTTSDVVLILTQYLSSFENMRKDNLIHDTWMDGETKVKTYKFRHNPYKYK